MKKLALFILVLSMIFVTSCGNSGQAEITTAESATTYSSATTTSKSTESVSTTNSGLNNDFHMGVYFNDYGEYLAYFENNEPENFVHYEDIADYGEFERFHSYTDKIDFYLYDLIDEYGNEFSITIYTKEILGEDFEPTTDHPSLEVSADGMTDMSICNNDTADENTGFLYVKIGNMKYWYLRNGVLYYISWKNNDLYYFLTPSHYDFRPYTQSTFADGEAPLIAKLLNRATAEAAVAEFSANINNTAE